MDLWWEYELGCHGLSELMLGGFDMGDVMEICWSWEFVSPKPLLKSGFDPNGWSSRPWEEIVAHLKKEENQLLMTWDQLVE